MPFISSVRRAFGPQGRKNTPYRLYAFSSHTFTAAGAGGRFGPTLGNCQSAYASTSWKNDSNVFGMDIQGIQRWKVPQTGRYRILTVGAPGGRACDNTAGWGSGTSMQGDFNLVAGQWLNILVGQRGINDPAHATYGSGTRMSAGGGGGSGVWLDSATEPLIMSGGGAGSSDQPEAFRSGRHSYTDATTSTTANAAYSDSGFTGTAGSGGQGGTTRCDNTSSNAAAGGGFKSAGTDCGAGGGARLQTSGVGGTANSGDSNRNSNGGQNMHGGFGGGGGPGGWYGCSGGGGGYSGGSAASDSSPVSRAAGGGGGSYNAGTNQSNSVLAAGQTGHGYITITRL